jgi:hypothetical protein
MSHKGRTTSIFSSAISQAGRQVSLPGSRNFFVDNALDVRGFINSSVGNITLSGTVIIPDGILHVPNQPHICVEKTSNDGLTSAITDLFQGGSATTHISQGIVYTNVDGRFTIPTGGDGIYVIMVTVFITSAQSPGTGVLSVYDTGVSVWNAPFAIHSAVDPVERSIMFIRSLSAGDYIEIFYDADSTNTMAGQAGSTFTMWKIA